MPSESTSSIHSPKPPPSTSCPAPAFIMDAGSLYFPSSTDLLDERPTSMSSTSLGLDVTMGEHCPKWLDISDILDLRGLVDEEAASKPGDMMFLRSPQIPSMFANMHAQLMPPADSAFATASGTGTEDRQFFEQTVEAPSHCPTPALTVSDISSWTDRSLTSYDDNGNVPNQPHYIMSAVEESTMNEALRAANASIIPSLLINDIPTLSAPPTHSAAGPSPSPASPHPSRKQRAPREKSTHKPTSSTSRRVRTSPQKRNARPRNIQADIDDLDLDNLVFSRDGDKVLCPMQGCTRKARREADIRRHVQTHRAAQIQAQIICCGVPVEQAAAYGIQDISGAYLWEGLWMVGGCEKGFTRKDSLRRHLEITSCKGDAGMSIQLLEMLQDRALAGQTMEGDGGD